MSTFHHRGGASLRLAAAFAAFCALGLCAAGRASAQAPTNDTATAAIALTTDKPIFGTTDLAADDYHSATTAAGTSAGPDVVYSFTPPGVGVYAIRVRPASEAVAATDTALFATTDLAALTGASPMTVTYGGAADANSGTTDAAEELLVIVQATGRAFTATGASVSMTFGETLFVVVDHAAGPGANFIIEAAHRRTETESNDAPASANGHRDAIAGTATGTADTDFFKIGNVVAGDRLFAAVDARYTTNKDFDVRVTTTTGTAEYDAEDGGLSVGGSSGVIAGAIAPEDGAVFAAVNHPGGVANSAYHVYAFSKGPTTTAFDETGADAGDTFGTALSEATHGGYVFGSLTSGTDVDVFEIADLVQGDTLTIFVDRSPAVGQASVPAISLDLLDENGAVIASSAQSHASPRDAGPSAGLVATSPTSGADVIVYRMPASVTRYAQISTSGAAGEYLLAIILNSGKPVFFMDEALVAFSTSAAGISSTAQAVTLTGYDLGGAEVTVTASTEFEVSNDGGTTFASSVTFAASAIGGGQSVLVRFNPSGSTTTFPVLGTLTASAAGATSETAPLSGSAPSINITGTLTEFKSTGQGTASTHQSITIEGVLVTTTITADAPANFQIRNPAASTTFTASITLPSNGASVPATSVDIRYLPTNTAINHAGDVVASTSGQVASKTIAVSGRIPTLTVTPTSLAEFVVSALTVSSTSQSFSFTATNLDPSQVVTVTPPTAFEIATASGGPFVAAPFTLTFTANGSGAIAATAIHVRYLPTSGTSHSDVVSVGASGALSQLVNVTGRIPSITITGTTTDFVVSATGTASATQTLQVSAVRLAASQTVTISVPAPFLVALGTATPSALSVNVNASAGGTLTAQTVTIGYTPTSGSVHTGNLTASATGAATASSALEGRVPTITIAGALATFSSGTVGVSSTAQTITVSAVGLDTTQTVTISVQPPFQIATSSSGPFLTTLTANATAGTLAGTTIFVRFVPTDGGSVTRSLTASATGATTRTLTLTGAGPSAPPRRRGGGGCATAGEGTDPWAALPWAMILALSAAGLAVRRGRHGIA